MIGEGLEVNYGMISGTARPELDKWQNGEIPDINANKDFSDQIPSGV